MTDTLHAAPLRSPEAITGERTALGAWAASLPIALFPPAAIWVLCLTVVSPASGYFGVVVGAVACAVHLFSYTLTGLPLFLWKFRKPESLVWRLPVSLGIGVLSGPGVAMIPMWRNGASPEDFPAAPLIVCALYGLITAVSAYRQRPHPETKQRISS